MKTRKTCASCALSYKVGNRPRRCARFICHIKDGADAPRILPHPRHCIGWRARS